MSTALRSLDNVDVDVAMTGITYYLTRQDARYAKLLPRLFWPYASAPPSTASQTEKLYDVDQFISIETDLRMNKNVITYLESVWQSVPEDKRNEALCVFAHNGFVNIMRALTVSMAVTREDIIANNNRVLIMAVEGGQAAMIVMLQDIVGFTIDEERLAYALLRAAELGYADVLLTLHNLFNLNADSVRGHDNNYNAFMRAVARGHAEVLKIFRRVYHMTDVDARVHNDLALRLAIKHGHVNVLRVLHKHFNVGTDVVFGHAEKALRIAAKRGHHEVIKALHNIFGLTYSVQLRGAYEKALITAAIFGHAEVVTALFDNHRLVFGDLDIGVVETVFIHVAQYGYATMLISLRPYCSSINRADLRIALQKAFVIAARYDRTAIMGLLYDLYDFRYLGAIYQECAALREAIIHGNALSLLVLHDKFIMRSADVHTSGAIASIGTKSEHVIVLYFLRYVYEMSVYDITRAGYSLLPRAASYNRLDVIRALHEIFKMDAINSREDCYSAFGIALNMNNAPLLKMLHEVFGLTLTNEEYNVAIGIATENGFHRAGEMLSAVYSPMLA